MLRPYNHTNLVLIVDMDAPSDDGWYKVLMYSDNDPQSTPWRDRVKIGNGIHKFETSWLRVLLVSGLSKETILDTYNEKWTKS